MTLTSVPLTLQSLAADLIEHLRDGIVVVDDRGVQVEVNAALCEMTGFSRDELVGAPAPHPYWPPEHVPTLSAGLHAALEGASGPLEFTFMRKNGERFPVIVNPNVLRDESGALVAAFAIVAEISERKEMEERLARSEQRYRAVVTGLHDGVLLLHRDGRVLACNPSAQRLAELTDAQAAGDEPVDLGRNLLREDGSPLPHDERPSQRALATGKPCRNVLLGLAQSTGERVWINVNSDPLFGDGEEKAYAVAISTADVTEHKRAADELSRSLEHWSTTFNAMRDAVSILGTDGRILQCNEEMVRLAGVGGVADLIGRPCHRLICGEADFTEGCPFATMLKSGQRESAELQVGDAWWEILVDPLRDDTGAITGAVHSIRDITAHKQLTERLREREERLRALVVALQEGIAVTDAEGVATWVNPRMAEMLGYSQEELVGRHAMEFLDEDGRELAHAYAERAIPSTSLAECKVQCKDGTWRSMSASIAMLQADDGSITGHIVGAQDTTRRKQAEAALRESEALHRGIFEEIASGVAVYEVRNDGATAHDYVIKRFNPAALAWTHAEPTDIGRPLGEVAPGIEDFGLIPVLQRVWQTGEPEYLPMAEYSDDRLHAWCESRVSRLPSGDILVVFDDVTERVHARNELDERAHELARQERLLSTLIDTIPSPVFYRDLTSRFLGCNRAFEELSGISREQIVGQPVEAVGPKSEAREYRERDEKLLANPGVDVRETHQQAADGGGHDFIVRKTVFTDASGAPAGIIGIMADITEQKKAEAALRRSESLLRGMFDEMTSGVTIYQVRNDGSSPDDFVIKEVNRVASELSGRTREDLIGRGAAEAWPTVEQFGLTPVLRRVWQSGKPEHFPQAEWVDDQLSAWYEDSVFRLATGDVAEIWDDVTSRVQAQLAAHDRERDLARQERLLRTLLETIPSPVYYKDVHGQFLGCNRAFEELIDMTREQIIGHPVEVTGSPEHAAVSRKTDAELLAKPGIQTYESTTVDATGAPHSMLNRKATFSDELGAVAGLVGVAIDITELKQAEEALRASATRLAGTLNDTVKAMGAIVELRDPYTGDHQRLTTALAVAIAQEIGLDEHRCEGLRHAGEVHDVGKIGVPAEILSRPGPITAAEMQLVRRHAALGGEVLDGIAFDWPVADIVRQHHERMDGSGYPAGLSGDQILLEARILAVADVVEAMSSHRPYRPALGLKAALAEVKGGAGTLYDPDVVSACERVLNREWRGSS